MKLTDIIKPNIPCVIIKNNNLTYKWDGTFLWTSDGLKCSLTKTFLFDTDFEYIDWQSYAKSLGYTVEYTHGVLRFSWKLEQHSFRWDFTLKIPEPKSAAEFDEIVRKLKEFS